MRLLRFLTKKCKFTQLCFGLTSAKFEPNWKILFLSCRTDVYCGGYESLVFLYFAFKPLNFWQSCFMTLQNKLFLAIFLKIGSHSLKIKKNRKTNAGRPLLIFTLILKTPLLSSYDTGKWVNWSVAPKFKKSSKLQQKDSSLRSSSVLIIIVLFEIKLKNI